MRSPKTEYHVPVMGGGRTEHLGDSGPDGGVLEQHHNRCLGALGILHFRGQATTALEARWSSLFLHRSTRERIYQAENGDTRAIGRVLGIYQAFMAIKHYYFESLLLGLFFFGVWFMISSCKPMRGAAHAFGCACLGSPSSSTVWCIVDSGRMCPSPHATLLHDSDGWHRMLHGATHAPASALELIHLIGRTRQFNLACPAVGCALHYTALHFAGGQPG
ncbi:hypothetical protein F5X68DRAFT_21561 [Plectosphaerella plurivora]|uniref:Uncharacterized protein n=1 Tax=Plectosphaerella plurivora TaxID=936078 RepID=A0A9P8V8Y5_9PEZI|nr:hypothetical protein F5X68DRAFT_21561 [Plectosphaerella plurivora]